MGGECCAWPEPGLLEHSVWMRLFCLRKSSFLFNAPSMHTVEGTKMSSFQSTGQHATGSALVPMPTPHLKISPGSGQSTMLQVPWSNGMSSFQNKKMPFRYPIRFDTPLGFAAKETPKRVPKQTGTKMSSFHKQKRCHFRMRAFLLTVGSFLLTVELFSLQLTILAFLLTVGAFLLTALASLLTVGAFLLTVGKCV